MDRDDPNTENSPPLGGVRLEAPTQRILSLDAGGVRCLSYLRVLRAMLLEIAQLTSEGAEHIPTPKPCECFDLICGSEWGAVLALMLGRLEMSIDECLQWFDEHEFSTRSPLRRSSEEPARQAFKQLLQTRGLNESTSLLKDDDDLAQQDEIHFAGPGRPEYCRSLVLVSDASRVGSVIRLRSYAAKMNGEVNLQHCTILQAAMAAIVIPGELPPVEINGRKYISAAVTGYGNPSREAFDEATRIWRPGALKVIISLGIGRKDTVPKVNGLLSRVFPTAEYINYMVHVVTDTERVAEETSRDARLSQTEYCRFVGPDLAKFQRQDWSAPSRRQISQETDFYLASDEIKSSLINSAQYCVIKDVKEQVELISDHGMNFTRHTRDVMGRSDIQGRDLSNDRSSMRTSSSQRSVKTESLLFDIQESSSEDRNKQADRWFKWFFDRTARIFPSIWPETVKRVKIAILDTGLDALHPFIKSRWQRPQYRSDGDILDDHGYKDFLNDPTSEHQPQDGCGHGTYVAGIILQLAPHAEIYIARVFESGTFNSGTGVTTRIAKALHYATDVWNVNIVSMSFGLESHSREIHQALNHAYAEGVVMLAAASNDGSNPLLPIAYPARQLGIVLCINSSDAWGNKSTFNPPPAAHRDNFSILGEYVLSTWPEHIAGASVIQDPDGTHLGRWKRLSGTSVATPIAAAVAVSLIQFKDLYSSKISRYQLVESFNGIRQLFARMTLDKSFLTLGGFDNIRPWEILHYDSWKWEDSISGKISDELKKI